MLFIKKKSMWNRVHFKILSKTHNYRGSVSFFTFHFYAGPAEKRITLTNLMIVESRKPRKHDSIENKFQSCLTDVWGRNFVNWTLLLVKKIFCLQTEFHLLNQAGWVFKKYMSKISFFLIKIKILFLTVSEIEYISYT